MKELNSTHVLAGYSRSATRLHLQKDLQDRRDGSGEVDDLVRLAARYPVAEVVDELSRLALDATQQLQTRDRAASLLRLSRDPKLTKVFKDLVWQFQQPELQGTALYGLAYLATAEAKSALQSCSTNHPTTVIQMVAQDYAEIVEWAMAARNVKLPWSVRKQAVEHLARSRASVAHDLIGVLADSEKDASRAAEIQLLYKQGNPWF